MYTTIHTLPLLTTTNQNVNCSLLSMTSSPNSPQEDLPPVIKHLQQKNKQRKLKEQDDKYNYDTNSK